MSALSHFKYANMHIYTGLIMASSCYDGLHLPTNNRQDALTWVAEGVDSRGFTRCDDHFLDHLLDC